MAEEGTGPAMTAPTDILVVDDDERITKALGRYLGSEGYSVRIAGCAEEFRVAMQAKAPDLIIMDLGLPDQDGLLLTREVRVTNDLPIIILSGKADPVDRVVGLEIGADDYVTKPFEPREILARVKAVMRRYSGSSAASGRGPGSQPGGAAGASDGAPPAREGRYRFLDWTLSVADYALHGPDGQVELTRKEFDLLSAFVEHPNRVLQRDFIMDLVGGEDWAPYDRRIDMLVAKLRKKLCDNPDDPRIIKTQRGFGYQFLPKVSRA